MTKIILEIKCPFCKESHFVETAKEEYMNYCAGELAQNAFPNLTSTEREQIISHLCPNCQKEIFE